MRRELNKKALELFPEDHGLVRALLLGDDSALSRELEESFRVIGASHLLVISGFHKMCIRDRYMLSPVYMRELWMIPRNSWNGPPLPKKGVS